MAMDTTKFKTPKQLREETGISEITQWRDRYPNGSLEFYRLAGRIVYSPDQIDRYLESKRVGQPATNALSSDAVAATA